MAARSRVDIRDLKENSTRNLFSLQFSPSYFHYANVCVRVSLTKKRNLSTGTLHPVCAKPPFSRFYLNNVDASEANVQYVPKVTINFVVRVFSREMKINPEVS